VGEGGNIALSFLFTIDLFSMRKELADPAYMANKPWNKIKNTPTRYVLPLNTQVRATSKYTGTCYL